MSSLVRKELEKVVVADLSHYDPLKNEFTIPKKVEKQLKEGHCYLIKINHEVLFPDSNSTFANNWNNGSVPPTEYMKVDVLKTLGVMVKVNSVGYDNESKKDLNVMWSGWLPVEQVDVLEEL